MSLEEWQHHVRHSHNDHTQSAWCGVTIGTMDWCFVTIDHAAYSLRNRNRMQPCPACMKAIISTLQGERL